jgi:hypothetical protein
MNTHSAELGVHNVIITYLPAGLIENSPAAIVANNNATQLPNQIRPYGRRWWWCLHQEK